MNGRRIADWGQVGLRPWRSGAVQGVGPTGLLSIAFTLSGVNCACCVLDQPPSSQRFEGKPTDEDARLTRRILEFVRQRLRWGYR